MKAIFVWDGECGFCAYWVARLARLDSGEIAFTAYQRLPRDESAGITEDEFKTAVHLIEKGGTVYAGASAFARVLALNRRAWWWTLGYERIKLVRAISEAVYRHVATHREYYSAFCRGLRVCPRA